MHERKQLKCELVQPSSDAIALREQLDQSMPTGNVDNDLGQIVPPTKEDRQVFANRASQLGWHPTTVVDDASADGRQMSTSSGAGSPLESPRTSQRVATPIEDEDVDVPLAVFLQHQQSPAWLQQMMDHVRAESAQQPPVPFASAAEQTLIDSPLGAIWDEELPQADNVVTPHSRPCFDCPPTSGGTSRLAMRASSTTPAPALMPTSRPDTEEGHTRHLWLPVQGIDGRDAIHQTVSVPLAKQLCSALQEGPPSPSHTRRAASAEGRRSCEPHATIHRQQPPPRPCTVEPAAERQPFQNGPFAPSRSKTPILPGCGGFQVNSKRPGIGGPSARATPETRAPSAIGSVRKTMQTTPAPASRPASRAGDVLPKLSATEAAASKTRGDAGASGKQQRVLHTGYVDKVRLGFVVDRTMRSLSARKGIASPRLPAA